MRSQGAVQLLHRPGIFCSGILSGARMLPYSLGLCLVSSLPGFPKGRLYGQLWTGIVICESIQTRRMFAGWNSNWGRQYLFAKFFILSLSPGCTQTPSNCWLLSKNTVGCWGQLPSTIIQAVGVLEVLVNLDRVCNVPIFLAISGREWE